MDKTVPGESAQNAQNSRARLMRGIPERPCDLCGEPFVPYRPNQRFHRNCKRENDRRHPETHWTQTVRTRASFACPKCHSRGSLVVDARGQRGFVRRRRKCQACGHGFATVERAVGE
jgi:hypothetical protein